ncbi:hypothetical protein [Acidovorax sp.]|uniref:hypothetical protein n=1 Tax=Acidovorax sp. TaxID=1872122 RepID=UPI002ACDDA04|nr:hypothetical protein [Acidovorax sp.]MDZ7865083.1 hypothetical protein [Acidovorax sp.]
MAQFATLRRNNFSAALASIAPNVSRRSLSGMSISAQKSSWFSTAAHLRFETAQLHDGIGSHIFGIVIVIDIGHPDPMIVGGEHGSRYAAILKVTFGLGQVLAQMFLHGTEVEAHVPESWRRKVLWSLLFKNLISQ